VTNERYILTEQVQRNLSDLARIVSLCDHPLLIQVKAMTTVYAARACSRKFWVADPGPTPDPTPFFSDLKGMQKFFFSSFFFI
jgi:hypothetical protein